jgi:hypothetical protein
MDYSGLQRSSAFSSKGANSVSGLL